MIVTEGPASNTWTAATIVNAYNYPVTNTGPAPQPGIGGSKATAKAESDQLVGKLGPLVTVYDAEGDSRMIGEAD
jgi:hypothetical protein